MNDLRPATERTSTVSPPPSNSLDASAEPPAPAAGKRRARPSIGLCLALVILGGLIVAAIVAPLLAPYSPTVQDLAHRLAGPSSAHWLGADNYGRDVLSRLLYGGRPAFLGVAIALGVSLVVGVPWGLAAGYWPRIVGTVLMRLVDGFLAFPAFVLAIAVIGVVGPGLFTSMTAVGVVYSPVLARLMRGAVLEVRRREFVQSARLSGCPARVIVLRHVLPWSIGPVIVQTSLFAGLAFIIEAGLSFLSFGVQEPEASWGGDLAAAYHYILASPGQVAPAGILIAVVVLCTYRVGDAVRDAFAGQGGSVSGR